MRSIIYIVLVGYFFFTAFLNLDGNEGQPVDLPKFITNSFESGEKVLPNEEWEDNLIGTWNFITAVDNAVFKGRVTYNSDKTFIRKVSFSEEREKYTAKSGGTVRGIWSVNDNNTWSETTKECVFSPDPNVCDYFSDTNIYGAKDSDTWDYQVVYFNKNRIDIRANNLAGNSYQTFKFTRE